MTRLLLTITFAIAFLQNPIYSQYDFDINNIPDSLSTKANSVIRHSHVNLDIYNDKMVYTYDYAITAINKKHENKLLFIESFSKNESKVKDVKINIYDADGQLIKKIKNKEIKDYGLQNIEFADDTRSLIYDYSSPVFPITMHVTYTHEIESPYYIKKWYPIPDFRQALEVATIRISDHAGESFDFQAYDLPEPIEQSASTLYYEFKQQKAFTKEKYMPSRWESLPRLEMSLKRLKYFDHVGTVNNWSEFGAWVYKEMFLPKQDLDYNQLKKETSQFINDEDSDLAKARKLYEYIQETTRYVLISLKDGGWSPLSVGTVHDRKYGDCKALSFYYNTLCKANGIDATLALVNAGESKRSAKEDFYSTSQFNHVISKLEIEDQTYWVDCTSKVNPFNFLGGFTDDRNVLLFNEEKGTIVKTPIYKEIHKTNTSMTYSMEGELEANIQMETEGVGITSKLYRVPAMSNQEMASYQKELLSKYTNPIISDYSYEFDTANLNFKENIKFLCHNAGERLGDYYKIEINRNELEYPKLKRDKNRVWPVQFLRNKTYEATTKVNHDLSLVPIIEDDVVLDSEFGKYTFSTIPSAGEILIKRSLTINKAIYDPERYNELKSFFDKIRKVEKRAILLSSKS